LSTFAWRAEQDRLPALIVLGALLSAVLVGVALARSIPLAVALLVALFYAPLVLVNLPLGVIAFVPILFFTAVPAFRFGPTLAGSLLVLAWVGALIGRRSEIVRLIREQRRYLVLAGALILWVNLSLAWSREPAAGSSFHFGWMQGAALYLIVVTTLVTRRHLRLAAAAFVVGAVASVVAGLSGGLETSQSAIELASNEGRLGGGSGDPNYLAAGIVPAVLLAVGLAVSTRSVLVRIACASAVVVLVIGFSAAESRGGLVAAATATIGAIVFFKRARAQVIAVLLIGLAAGAVWFSVNPEAWQRISSFDASGTGRSELWSIGWQMGLDNPVAGVGLQNFLVESSAYVDRSGPLKFVDFITERPLVVHNVYIQTFAELGAIGLALYLALVIASLQAARLAARRFEQRGDRDMANLARAALVAGLATMAGSFFISDAHQARNWLNYALGPALLAASARPLEEKRGDAGSRRPHLVRN
jgi:O-antigen ligase